MNFNFDVKDIPGVRQTKRADSRVA